MTSFNFLLSSIGVDLQTPQQVPAGARQSTESKGVKQSLTATPNATPLTPNNAAAGVKRKADERGSDPRSGSSNIKQDDAKGQPPTGTPGGRVTLPGKARTVSKPADTNNRTIGKTTMTPSQQKSGMRPIPKPGATTNPPAASANTTRTPAPAKRGYASMMERAKAAQVAAQAAGPSGIKHKQKTVERLSNRDKQRLLEEQKAQQKAAKRGARAGLQDGSRSGTSNPGKAVGQKKGAELSYKGTMKKAPEPLAYKGTMRANTSGGTKTAPKKKSEPEGKWGGYASWSDLDDAEDDQEEWDSEGSSDMEGGFDDMEQEEMLALHAARKEDQEALEQEERHRREKLERKRKLQELSKSAAAKKKY